MNTKGREMTKFLVTVTAMLVLLVVGLVTYNTLDATRTLNNDQRPHRRDHRGA